MSKIRFTGCVWAWLFASALSPAAFAITTDLATVPLITSAPLTVKPNLLFILDDSGSMNWTHMPDDANGFASFSGYKSSHCNGVYYDPAIAYAPPKTSTGTNFANSSFTNAWVNGYKTSDGTVNLSSNFMANSGDSSQAAYYYTYSGAQLSEAQKNYFDHSSTFYTECNSNSILFTKVTVSATSGPGATDERANFANWYSYYRTRMLMMKTATGLAFQDVGDKYRVGYMSINDNVNPSFLNLAPFDATQKASWFTKLYGASPNNSTPLRKALSDAGRIFAHKQTSMYGVTVTDPIEYSCQKNFTLLSTDGYWNGTAGVQVDGWTAIGNRDSSEPRPFNDGGTSSNVYQATITVSGGTSPQTLASSIKINGFEILSGATIVTGISNTVAQRVATKINNCQTSITGSCTIAGYKAVVNSNVVTITAPASLGAVSFTPVIIKSGVKTVAASAFSGSLVTSGGASDTLADVAQYYYETDLRSAALGNQLGALGTDVSANDVLPGVEDIATNQHMTTFTLGLGGRGRMVFSPTYKTDTTGDFNAVKNGSTASSTVCTWQTAGMPCNWPIPGADLPENIDDLWHAAVNGRGTYFSATNPTSLAVGLNSTLQAITAVTSDAAAATTSNPNVTDGDNFIFSSTFRSAEWYGDFERRQVNVSTGEPEATNDWDARPMLDANVSRTIYTRDTGAATGRKLFLWANLTATEQAYFSMPYISSTASPTLSQFCLAGGICLTAPNQTLASGSALLNFIRGDRTNEGAASDIGKYFRLRTSVFGDIVDGEAVYVKVPAFEYADSGYSTYKSANASRTPMVYVGANDGMLHAFNASAGVDGGGAEVWAYVPQTLLPYLYKLADKYYPTNHQYYVDGSPTQTDVKFTDGTWHTILVGGFNAGGRGYYALDVTVPNDPKVLWEVSNATTGFANLGYSFGRPEIAKLKDGTWVVLLTSGYNNVSPGDGKGYLYVVDAATGALIRAIGTGVGSASAAIAGVCATAPCPSGLAQIRALVDNAKYDNTVQRVYGGDLYGNVWRFDVNGDVGASGYDAQLLATLRGGSGNVQSVTARPEVGKVAGFTVVFVGTGRYLGATDLSNSEVQSIYAIKDNLGATSLGNPRLGGTFVQQTLTEGTCPAGATFCALNSRIRTASSNGVNFATNNGWFVDLPGTRERANTDPQLSLGTLSITTNLLNPSACTVGGSSFINYFDYRTGGAVSTASGMASLFLGDALATRPVLLRFGSAGSVRSLVRMSDNTWRTPPTPIPPSPGGTRRTSWRELVSE